MQKQTNSYLGSYPNSSQNLQQSSLFQLLKNNHVFTNIDHYDFSIIEDYLFFRGLESGEFLFKEGSHGDFMAFVVAGALNIIKRDNENQRNIHIATMKVGDSIGDMALLDDLSRSASIQACEKTGLIILPRADFERILTEHPKIGIKIMKGLASSLSLNLRRTSEQLSLARSKHKAVVNEVTESKQKVR